jgi:general secretion pathway protein G
MSTDRDRTRSDAGFTLLEILVVVAILGLLIGLVARQSIERIGSVLDLYKLDVGSYPTTDEGLAALVSKPSGVDVWNGPYLKADAVPVDPWNHPYIYRDPSERAGHEYDLCSQGPNPSAGESSLICNP